MSGNEKRGSGATRPGSREPDFRAYLPAECGSDGYPFVWHSDLKYAVREAADHRCIRCHHPYTKATSTARGEWSPCDAECDHLGDPGRLVHIHEDGPGIMLDWPHHADVPQRARERHEYALELIEKYPGEDERRIEAQWRILTVHHLDGDKANCRWWNLAALCQRCHLTIQGRVVMDRIYPWEHTDWFKPYVAGFYGFRYLGQELTREETESRLNELLALELASANEPRGEASLTQNQPKEAE